MSEEERAGVEIEHTAATLDMRAFGYQANPGDLLIVSVFGEVHTAIVEQESPAAVSTAATGLADPREASRE